MADIVEPTVRSRMMSSIRNRGTKPEMIIRRALFAKGYRYRLHRKDLPGVPDLVFPSRRAVIFVHGCFWHGHECNIFRWPSTRTQWWREKILANRVRDVRVAEQLRARGWRQARIWECALKGSRRHELANLLDTIGDWLDDGNKDIEIGGIE